MDHTIAKIKILDTIPCIEVLSSKQNSVFRDLNVRDLGVYISGLTLRAAGDLKHELLQISSKRAKIIGSKDLQSRAGMSWLWHVRQLEELGIDMQGSQNLCSLGNSTVSYSHALHPSSWSARQAGVSKTLEYHDLDQDAVSSTLRSCSVTFLLEH